MANALNQVDNLETQARSQLALLLKAILEDKRSEAELLRGNKPAYTVSYRIRGGRIFFEGNVYVRDRDMCVTIPYSCELSVDDFLNCLDVYDMKKVDKKLAEAHPNNLFI